MKINKTLLILFIITFTQSVFYTQVIKDSLSFSNKEYIKNVFGTSLEKRLNTYNLYSTFKYSKSINNIFLGIDENYFSSLINSSKKNIKDEQVISIIGEYSYSPSLRFGTLTQNSIYSNDRKIAINEASNTSSVIYSKIFPINELQIVPYVGYSINKQVNEDDRGLIYGGNLNLNRTSVSDFIISSNIKYQKEEISPRTNSQQKADIQIRNDLDFSITNIITADYSNTRKDFYFDTDSLTAKLFDINRNIQSRVEKKYFIEERLFNSRFSSNFFFDISGKISLRDIDRNIKFKNLANIELSSFDTKIEEFRIEFSGTTEYRSNFFFGKLKVDFSEREEKHAAKRLPNANEILFDRRYQQETNKNNNSDYTTVSAIGSFQISPKDNFSFSLLQRKLVFNTPSDENFDDRDELLSIFRLSYLRDFNHLFNFFVHLEGSYNHIVYISSKRSSNNNIRRILKLSSGGDYKSSYLYSKNTFAVSANYTTFDFEDINPNSRSYSFRQFSAKDTTSIKLIGNIYTDFLGYVKLSEQGDFVWSNFTNKPDRLLAEYYLEPLLNIKTPNINFGVGLRIFTLKTFRYKTGDKQYLDNEYKSIGPITNFSFELNNVYLYFSGWYEFITNKNNSKRELANLNLSVNWQL